MRERKFRMAEWLLIVHWAGPSAGDSGYIREEHSELVGIFR